MLWLRAQEMAEQTLATPRVVPKASFKMVFMISSHMKNFQ
jgi:hypothetical protein